MIKLLLYPAVFLAFYIVPSSCMPFLLVLACNRLQFSVSLCMLLSDLLRLRVRPHSASVVNSNEKPKSAKPARPATATGSMRHR